MKGKSILEAVVRKKLIIIRIELKGLNVELFSSIFILIRLKV